MIVQEVEHDYTLLTDYDIQLFRQGEHYRLYEKLGSHVIDSQERSGTYFAVWAPNAKSVSVMGEFNSWKRTPILSAGAGTVQAFGRDSCQR